MMDTPTKLSEIKALVSNQVQENLHLEYKSSAALLGNSGLAIAKTITAFAHSDGGFVIYGVEEVDSIPIRVDEGLTKSQFSREKLEQLIMSHVNPRVESLRIFPITVSKGHSIFVVEVPKSTGRVHQASDNKYYKRHNFRAVPMEGYEIDDVRQRTNSVSPLINIDLEIVGSFFCVVVSNIGHKVARSVTFEFPSDHKWYGGRETPRLIANGIESFPPGKTYRFRWVFVNSLFADGNESKRKFAARVSYWNPEISSRVADEFHLDADSFFGTFPMRSDVDRLEQTIKEDSRKLLAEIKKVGQWLEEISQITKPTGLTLSIPTIKNLKKISSGESTLEKIDAHESTYKVFKEVLNIDFDLAYNLEMHFRYSGMKNLSDIDRITPKLIEKIREQFYFDEPEIESEA